ncbi:hypothetical protein SKAU_G00411140 [Synaphobranchus kaupii]|uniref:Uncharacterized protein n=1 Tax=Synaphobranchus kaupii TaxID=118154 RepID=A0A9Q1IAY5_SYNKA|nr:hypothetical protein SKAU_G00411140 [Synaphobranchus kaupii]
MPGAGCSKPELDWRFWNGLFQTGTGLDWNWTGWSTRESGTGTECPKPELDWTELDREVHTGIRYWNGMSQTGTGLDWNWTGRSTRESGTGTECPKPELDFERVACTTHAGTGLELAGERLTTAGQDWTGQTAPV